MVLIYSDVPTSITHFSPAYSSLALCARDHGEEVQVQRLCGVETHVQIILHLISVDSRMEKSFMLILQRCRIRRDKVPYPVPTV